MLAAKTGRKKVDIVRMGGWVEGGGEVDNCAFMAIVLLVVPMLYFESRIRSPIAVLKKVRYALCPMPYAHEYLIFLRKAISQFQCRTFYRSCWRPQRYKYWRWKKNRIFSILYRIESTKLILNT